MISFLFAIIAAWISYQWIDSNFKKPNETTDIVVAATEIAHGVKLDESMIKTIAWPSSLIPQGAYTSKEMVINKVTMNKYFPGEIITNNRLSDHLSGSTLSALILKEYRAISVRVDDVVGVAGFILPGNRVDILKTQLETSSNTAITKTILQDIKVLAVDQEVSQDKEKPTIVRAVTLELKPEQAEIIVKAMREGTIQLTLRNPIDAGRFESKNDIKYEPEKITKFKHPLTPKQIVIPW
jgi:pilus assembly protein CpaB